MRVRLTTQVSGTRDGQNWPEPGTVVDLPDAEARALVSGGAAVKTDAEVGTVLVPPDGIHTPGAVTHGGTQRLVEVPTDAVSDPERARAAVKARAEGDYHEIEVPAGTGIQAPSGAALPPDRVREVAEDEKQVRADLAAGRVATVGETAPARKTAAEKAAADKTTK